MLGGRPIRAPQPVRQLMQTLYGTRGEAIGPEQVIEQLQAARGFVQPAAGLRRVCRGGAGVADTVQDVLQRCVLRRQRAWNTNRVRGGGGVRATTG